MLPDQLLVVVHRLNELQSVLRTFPIELLVLSLSAASVITMLLMAPTDYRFEKMRLQGIPRAVLAMILSGVVALCILSFGLDAIKSARSDVPWWLGLALLTVCAAGFIGVIYLHLRHRETFTFSRFTNAVVIPLAAPVIPLFGVIQSAWGIAL